MRIRMLSTITMALVVLAGTAVADKAKPKKPSKPKPKVATKAEPAPGKGFWKVLVKPHATWTLYMDGETEQKGTDYQPSPITIETYDVRKVGDADVARMRWRQGKGNSESALSFTHAPSLDQFAVTSEGLYFLSADMDDKKIAEVLKGKPMRSDPPKAYKGTKVNDGRYLEIRDGLVCIGQGPTPDAPDCEDVCEGDVCISATDGIVRLDGNWAPDMFDYAQVKPKSK